MSSPATGPGPRPPAAPRRRRVSDPSRAAAARRPLRGPAPFRRPPPVPARVLGLALIVGLPALGPRWAEAAAPGPPEDIDGRAPRCTAVAVADAGGGAGGAGQVAAATRRVVADTTVEAASALVDAGRFAEAVEILEEVVQREPANGPAWSLMGHALRSVGETGRAVQAHLRAAEVPGTAPAAMYDVAMLYAVRGEVDRAFGWLFRARDTGRIDVTRVAVDPDADALRRDPRYREVFPSPAELADPFVEPVRVIHEWRGEEAGDQFGWIARAAGDVDGDGRQDVVTSSPGYGDDAGKVYLYTSRTGALLWSGTGRPGERLGLGVEAAGDVDGDGIPDVAAGAPGADRVYVLSGSDGRLVLTLEGADGEMFGRRAVGVGDVDGDGHADVLVGAPGNDATAGDAGAAYLFSGGDGSRLLTLRGEGPGDALGSSLSGATVEGRTRLVVGAPGAGPGARGRVYVHDGDGALVFQVDADDTGAALGGMFVSLVGDVDGDALLDIYASDWSNAAEGPTTGRAYVHSGADGSRLHTFTGEAAGDGFGIGTAEAGDVDGDGRDDLAIGAWRQGGAAPAGGKVYLFSGADGRLLRSVTGRVMGETLGFDATGVGDVDGDGIRDLLVTSAWSAVNGPRSGRVWVLSGLWTER